MLGFVGLAFFWKLASGTARNSSFMEAIINVRILVKHFLILDYVLKSWEVLLMFHKTLLTLSSLGGTYW